MAWSYTCLKVFLETSIRYIETCCLLRMTDYRRESFKGCTTLSATLGWIWDPPAYELWKFMT